MFSPSRPYWGNWAHLSQCLVTPGRRKFSSLSFSKHEHSEGAGWSPRNWASRAICPSIGRALNPSVPREGSLGTRDTPTPPCSHVFTRRLLKTPGSPPRCRARDQVDGEIQGRLGSLGVFPPSGSRLRATPALLCVCTRPFFPGPLASSFSPQA